MTTMTATSSVVHRPFSRRIWDVVRLHFANPATVVWTPLMILAIIFALLLKAEDKAKGYGLELPNQKQ